jgi:hypothetical protein
MALDADALGNTIKSAIATALKAAWSDHQTDPNIKHGLEGLSDTIAGAIAPAVAAGVVNHFKANAEVLPSGTPAMTAGGDPVLGEGKIT